MDDFAEMILKEDLSKLPVVRSDIGDPWIHGTMSMPEASKLALNIRPSIGGMDELSTLENIWGIYRPTCVGLLPTLMNKAFFTVNILEVQLVADGGDDAEVHDMAQPPEHSCRAHSRLRDQADVAHG